MFGKDIVSVNVRKESFQFQIHGPDAGTPIAEVVRTMDELVRSGKVRYVGSLQLDGMAASKNYWSWKTDGCKPLGHSAGRDKISALEQF